MYSFLQNNHVVQGLPPVADAFAGTVYSDIINLSAWDEITFIRYHGVGTTGTSTLTCQACDDVSASNTTAVPFHYKALTGSDDVLGALTKATTSGFTTTAGSNRLFLCTVRAQDLASTGYKYVRLKSVESAASAVLGGILVILGKPRIAQDIPATAIV